MRERGHIEEGGLEGRTILKCIFKKLVGVMDWIDLAQDRDKWEILINAIIHKMPGIS